MKSQLNPQILKEAFEKMSKPQKREYFYCGQCDTPTLWTGFNPTKPINGLATFVCAICARPA